MGCPSENVVEKLENEQELLLKEIKNLAKVERQLSYDLEKAKT